MTSFPHSAGTARPYVWAPDQSPAYWNVGTCWRVRADGSQPTAGPARSRSSVRKDSSPHRTSTTRGKTRAGRQLGCGQLLAPPSATTDVR